jgi:hypothetical protein
MSIDQNDDIRDRLARSEQNHINLKENFMNFKAEVQNEFSTLSKKIDLLMTEIDGIKLVIAKWLGAGGVVMVIGQFLLDKLIK